MKYIENISYKRVAYTKFCSFMPPKTRELLEGKKCFWNLGYRAKVTDVINKYHNEQICHVDIWKKAYRKLCYKDHQYLIEAEIFFLANIKNIKKSKSKLTNISVILILVVKNDLLRVKMLLSYYRRLGIERFVVLDDKSVDGTLEYLLSQDDVDVYNSDVNYTTLGRQAWISRLVDLYGFNRWYLIVDSDELIAYSGMEEKSIPELTCYLDSVGRNVLRMMLLEMYPRNDILKMPSLTAEQITSTYIYFDCDGYRIQYTDLLTCVVGGARCREFYNGNYKEAPYLTKYPLIKICSGMIPCHSHMNFPFCYNRNTPLSGCMLHYKFLPQDIEKYRQRVREGNFQSSSKEYKKYLDLISIDGEFIMYDKEISIEYKDSSSLDIFEIEHFE